MSHRRLRVPRWDPRLREDRDRRTLGPAAQRRRQAAAPPVSRARARTTLMTEAATEAGWVAPELREEFPGLALRYLSVDGGSARTPRHVKGRLSDLSNR